ncbi:MAG: hypothetical protein Tp1111DCM298921_6 [Prokaryotic dsDNA virus sp.]|nr:MAG: hypothetical protein Tp1111DCM298921_6 [Prokaryotic dsDNA virus sp.]|tara:strand:- start:630 stop:923 length:294 start_codon:yes stop_codon:yes gene_type:complete
MKKQENKTGMTLPTTNTKDQEVYHLDYFGWGTKRLEIPMLTSDDLDDAIDVFKDVLDELKAIKRAELRMSMKAAIAQRILDHARLTLRERRSTRDAE